MRRFHFVLHSRATATCLCAALLTLTGCGPGPAPAPQPAPPAETSEPAPPNGQVGQGSAPTGGQSSKTKWIGDIPYDVFYDQPLVVAADSNSLAPSISTPDLTDASQAAPEMPTPSSGDPAPPSPPATGDSPAGATPDWPQLVKADVLNDAVVQIRNRLTTNLNTLATYNRNIDAIVTDGASLAALAAVAEVHPDAVSWKDKAKYVRDLGNEIYQNAGGTGREPYDATKLPFEQIVAMLNGGPPPDIEAADNVPFADVADRYEMMKRIKQSFDYLRAEINTESRFKESPEDIIREASVLAGFGGVLSSESYDSADQEMYQNFIRQFMQANVDVVKATHADDFAAFETARNQVQQACDKCHAEYAFGTDSF